MSAPAQTRTIEIDWGQQDLPPPERRDWLVSWLVSEDGEEGDFVYDGPSGATTSHTVPPEAIGLKFRWAQPPPGGPDGGFRRSWTVLRKPYLFADHPEAELQPLTFCP